MGRATTILGIHDGHNCGASLSIDGRIVASVSEERLTRVKNEVGYPRLAIEAVLKLAGVEVGELTEVAYASLFMHSADHLKDPRPWYRVDIGDQRQAAAKPKSYEKVIFEQRRQERIDLVVEHLGVAADKIGFVEHHLAHLTAAYFTAPFVSADQPVLGLTCDGSGDNVCATVTVCRAGKFDRIATTNRHASLGKIYSRVTMLMGMNPWEHEYKLMGLAPYAAPESCRIAAGPLHNLIRVGDDGLSFAQVGELSTNYSLGFLRQAFDCVRFDTIAGAVQVFTEEMLTAWVKSAVEKTGIRDIVCGGGVFMNVKANMLIAQLPEVRSMYVMPSAADESLSIGAALHRHYEVTRETDYDKSTLTDLYLGRDASRSEELLAIEEAARTHDLEVRESNNIDAEAADMLAAGRVVARSRGRAEWGARALGNRSILAPAHDYAVVDRINRMIKQRDFWMPFAPSIIDSAAPRYFDDPKDLKPWFMTFAFPAHESTRDDLVAGSHPRDHTVRAQVVTAAANPGYHSLIQRFEQRTGRGVVLNTSFNLHGYPIVDTPADAIDVLVRSGLDTLALNNFIVTKRAAT